MSLATPDLPHELSRYHELLSEALQHLDTQSADLGRRIALHLERIEKELARIKSREQQQS